MKLTVLLDNNTYIDHYYLGEPAVCYYLEDGDARILLDVGYSDAFLQNAAKLSIDLGQVTDIVLSHGHNDHTGGLQAYFDAFPENRVRITACPGVFEGKRSDDGLFIGSPMTQGEVAEKCDLRIVEEPMRISEHVTFLGPIPSQTGFERQRPIGQRLTVEGWLEDYLADDTALALETGNQLFLLLGCSHSGVCNIILRAQALFPGRKITGLLGGMHLFDLDNRTEQTIEFLRQQKFDILYPCHCTSFAVRAAMSRCLPVQEVGVSMTLDL